MKKELIKEFVGIDVSKLTLDVHLHVKNLHCVFSNDSKGLLSMFSWIHKQCRKNEELRFCFEHTGIYSLELAVFLRKHDQVIYIVSGLAIKRSMGLKSLCVKANRTSFRCDSRTSNAYIIQKQLS